MKKLLLLLPITLASLFGVQTYTVDTSTHMEVIFVEEIYGRFFTDEDGGIYLTHPVLPSYKEDPEEKEGKLDYISCKEKDMVAFEGYGDFNLRNDSNEYLYGVTKPIKGYPYIIKMNQANESSNSKTYGSQSCTLQYEYTYVMAHFAGEESSSWGCPRSFSHQLPPEPEAAWPRSRAVQHPLLCAPARRAASSPCAPPPCVSWLPCELLRPGCHGHCAPVSVPTCLRWPRPR